MLKKSLILLLCVIFLVCAFFVLKHRFFRSSDAAAPSRYAAVTITNGDMYFGKLSLFPWPTLKNVWVLERSVDAQNQFQFGINPMSKAFWNPVDRLYLNPKQILTWSWLRNDSQVVKFLENPPALDRSGTPTSTFKGPSSPPPAEE